MWASTRRITGCDVEAVGTGIFSMIKFDSYNSLRNLATGIFSCSLYLATVRRAIL